VTVASFPKAQRAYVSAVATAGALAIGVSLHDVWIRVLPLEWFLLAALTLVTATATLRLPSVAASFSISDIFTISATLLFGPAAGCLTVALDGLAISARLARRHLPTYRIVFNATAPALAMWAAAHVFFWIAGTGPLARQHTEISALIVPLVVFAAVYFALNTGLIACAIAIETSVSPVRLWLKHFVSLSFSFFVGSSVAALLVILIDQQSHGLLVMLVLAPLPLVLYQMFKKSVQHAENQVAHLDKVNRMYLATIEALATAIDAKDQITHGHIRRVQRSAMRLAMACGLNDESELKAIDAAGLLHDMGKLAVSEHLLNKPGRLNPTEFAKVKQHAAIGADILSMIDFPYPVVPIVRHHHENWDGSGYPDGLKGEEIPIGARILSVVDCYDALTSDRPYRSAMPANEAIKIIQQRRGVMYDPHVVDRFVNLYQDLELATEDDSASRTVLAAVAQTFQPDAERPFDSRPADGLEVFKVVCEIGNEMARHKEFGAAWQAVWTRLQQIVPASSGVFFAYDAASDRLVARVVSGNHAAALSSLEIPLGQRLSGWVAANRTPIINSDAALDLGNATMTLMPPPLTCVSVPLLDGDKLVGVFTAYADAINSRFNEEDARILQVVAEQAVALFGVAAAELPTSAVQSAPQVLERAPQPETRAQAAFGNIRKFRARAVANGTDGWRR
jgi:putative nucleotidyltransferase with HDIG domain